MSLPLALTIIERQIKCAKSNYKGSRYVFALNKFGYPISLIGNRLHTGDDQCLIVGWSWVVVIAAIVG